MANILVVDDEPGIRALLAEILGDEGHSVDTAENAAQARNARNARGYDLALLDIWMPDTDGVSLLKEWRAGGQIDTMPVIMMSGHASIETALAATRIGAQSFLEKPITMAKLLLAVKQALEPPPEEPPLPAPAAPPAPDAAAAARARAAVQAQAAQTLAEQKARQAQAAHCPPARQCFDLDSRLRSVRDDFERAYFEYHLARAGGSMTRVAESTGLERTHLYRKLRHLGVNMGRGRGDNANTGDTENGKDEGRL